MSFINLEHKVSLTILDQNIESDFFKNILFVRSPRRTCENLLKKINKPKETCIDTFPTSYLSYLPFTHFLYFIEPLYRVSSFFEKIKEATTYTITKNYFPRRKQRGVEDFVDFLCETYKPNLKYELLPYNELKFDWIPLNIDNVYELTNLLDMDVPPITVNKWEPNHILDDKDNRIKRYYE